MNDILYRPQAVSVPEERRDGAKITVVGTTARSLDGVEKTAVLGMKQVKPRVEHAREVGELLAFVNPVHPAIFQVRKNAIEYPFRFTYDDGIGMLKRFFRKGRRMHAPHQNRNALVVKMVRQVISTTGIEGKRRDPDKIDLPAEIDLLDGFVGDQDFPILGEEGSNGNHSQDRKDRDRLLGHHQGFFS